MARDFRHEYARATGYAFPVPTSKHREQVRYLSRIVIPFHRTWEAARVQRELCRLAHTYGDSKDAMLVGIAYKNAYRPLHLRLRAYNTEQHESFADYNVFNSKLTSQSV